MTFKKEKPDGGWGWVVTAACFIDHVLFMGTVNSMGIFYTYIMEDFDVGLAPATFIGGVYTGLCYGGAVFSVPLAERFGDRFIIMIGGLLNFIGLLCSSFVTSFPVLIFTMALLPGIGNSLSFPILFTSVDRYFDKKKYIAMSVGVAGASVGIVSLPVLSEILLSKYGFHGTILIHSALSLHVVLCGAVVFPLYNEKRQSQGVKTKESEICKECREPTGISFCKTPRYISYLFTNLLLMTAFYIPSGQLPKTAMSVGVDINDVLFAVSMGGISSGCGRLCFGVLCHYFKYHIIMIWIFFLIGLGLSMLIVPFSTSFSHFLIFTILYGFFEGGNAVGWNLSQKNIIKPKQYGRSLSIVLLVDSIGVVIGNPLTAMFVETFDNPGIPFYIGTTIIVLGAVMICPFAKTKIDHITDTIIDVQCNEPTNTGQNGSNFSQQSLYIQRYEDELETKRELKTIPTTKDTSVISIQSSGTEMASSTNNDI